MTGYGLSTTSFAIQRKMVTFHTPAYFIQTAWLSDFTFGLEL